MSSIDSRIMAFITENDLDEGIKDSLIDLVQGCFTDYVSHMSGEWLQAPISSKKESVPKTKKEKLDDPTEATSLEDLRKCTADILNAYCKENGLKIGGNKHDIMERVWRHVEGNSSDEDLGRAAKPKKEKVKREVHQCSSCNAKGKACGNAATEEKNGKWFCFRHIDDVEEEEETEPEIVPEPKKTGVKPSAALFKKK